MKQQTKEDIKSFMILFTTPLLILIITYPTSVVAHETTHVITYSLDNAHVVGYHIFSPDALEKGWQGYVEYYGQTTYDKQTHEIIAYIVGYTTQILLIIFFVFYTDIKTILIRTIQQIQPASQETIP